VGKIIRQVCVSVCVMITNRGALWNDVMSVAIEQTDESLASP